MTDRPNSDLKWLSQHIQSEQEKGSFCKITVHLQDGQITLVERLETFKPPKAGMTPKQTGN